MQDINKGTSTEWSDVVEKIEIDSDNNDAGAHYRHFMTFNGVTVQLDPFRLAEVLKIDDAVQFTVFKKAIRWGGSSAKDLEQDLKDIISACERKLEMINEDHFENL